AIPETLMEAELFGYERGAFTGAVGAKKGIFEMADGGTLFLDEIGDLPLHLQSKLLGVIEEKKIRRLGSESARPVNVRIIASTSVEIEQALGSTFRSDLYFRLSVIRIHMPPLRERKGDIPQLCAYLLKEITGGTWVKIKEEEPAKLMRYEWPGNVRELKNILERAFILQRGPVLKPSELLVPASKGTMPVTSTPLHDTQTSGEIMTLADVERDCIRNALQRLSYNYSRTARALGISLSTLKRKLNSYQSK
ncbi:MAG: sigma 54-interacting transcriptional regulator, partial [Chloroflexota bacterium]